MQALAVATLRKFNAKTGEFSGVLVTEALDVDNEIVDYLLSKPYFEKWAAAARERSGGKSCGNIRLMHSLKAVGYLTDIQFDDAAKRITVKGCITDPEALTMAEKGVLTGLSTGAKTVRRIPGLGGTRLVLKPVEASLVDNPANTETSFELTTKAGQVEQRPLLGRFEEDAVVKTEAEQAAEKAALTAKRQAAETQDLIERLVSMEASLVEMTEKVAALEPPARAGLTGDFQVDITKAQADLAAGYTALAEESKKAATTDAEKAAQATAVADRLTKLAEQHKEIAQHFVPTTKAAVPAGATKEEIAVIVADAIKASKADDAKSTAEGVVELVKSLLTVPADAQKAAQASFVDVDKVKTLTAAVAAETPAQLEAMRLKAASPDPKIAAEGQAELAASRSRAMRVSLLQPQDGSRFLRPAN